MESSDPTPPSPVRVVVKFGGSSVSSRSGWDTIARLVRDRSAAGEHLLIVHSALSGVTDWLEALVESAVRGHFIEAYDALVDRHESLADELAVPHDVLEGEFGELRRTLEGIAMVGEATPRVRALVLAAGERLSTTLGAAHLASRGTPVVWLPATELLQSVETDRQTGEARWLSAECTTDLDPDLGARLDALDRPGLTQGFTARNSGGDTVLLGRGGSDTSAAYLAGRWGADRLEIWSDVPGMFSADPRFVPSARLLERLDYREAQEIATTGSKVLHPRAIRALRERRIPIHLRSTVDPSAPGTVIEPREGPESAMVKAISWKPGVVLVSMETLGMWQEVGFLARAFEVFRDHGLSIDLVSTSETNVTVSLDAKAQLLDEDDLQRAASALSEFCGVEIIRPCAAVSLVGSRIRGMLDRLGPALSAFRDHSVHLVSQAASDLNFTVVIDEGGAEAVVQQLHDALIPRPGEPESGGFGPSWEQLEAGPGAQVSAPSPAEPRA